MDGQPIIECYDALESWDIATIDDLIEEDVVDDDMDDQQQVYQECEVTEEVVIGDWAQGGENIIQVTVGQTRHEPVEDDIVPLPVEQDEYASRPYPCDFCSRRFRKKANLKNHMIAHQNDRPYCCKLCGARYIRKSDLHNHLRIHAYKADGYDEPDLVDYVNSNDTKLDFSDILTSPSTSRKQKSNKKFVSVDPRKPFVCQVCGVTFAREKALTAHQLLHGEKTLLDCDKCDEQFWDVSVMRKHKRQHILDEQASLDAEFDDEATASDTETRGMKDPIYGCTECARSYNSIHDLNAHMEIHTQHCCNVCGESFAEALDLLAHAEVHARNQHHRCMICGDSFFDESEIKVHIKKIHQHEITETTCRVCGKLCKDGRSLMRHSWDHSNRSSHSCSSCAKSFNNKARLKRHMLSHKNKTVVCDTCGEEFSDGRSLMNHRHSHTKALQFNCTECGKSFGSRSSQQIHMRIHTGEKPYQCRYCWKAFADGGTLRKHERIHTGEKPYACAVCPRAFNQRVVLREHIRSHHSAPDTKNGRPFAPYFCTVCTLTLATASELISHLVQHSDNNTQARRKPIDGPRKYKRRRSRPTLDSKHNQRKDIFEEIVTYSFRKSVPSRIPQEDFQLPVELVPDIRQQTIRYKEPKLEEIPIKSENFPLLDDGQPLETKVDFFSESMMKFDPGVVNDLKEILQSPVKERNDGRPRRSVRPTLKSLESQQQEKEFTKKGGKAVEENRCQICGIAFSNHSSLLSHVKVHM